MTMQKKNILNNFKDVLGQYCAINQFIELSKRCFVLDHEKDMATRENFIALATRNSVTLTDYNAENMVNAISRSYIVNVNLCFETFLKDACTQVRKYGRGTYQDKVQEQSWLKCATNNIIQDKLPADKQAIYDLCEYYRLIRNSAVHDLCEVDDHIKEYKKLQKYDFKVEAKFSKLSAPNEYDNIQLELLKLKKDKRVLLKLLLLGDKIELNEIENTIGTEFLNLLIELGIVIKSDGYVQTDSYIIISFLDKYFLVGLPYNNPNCRIKDPSVYIGMDTYRLTENITSNRVDKV